MRILVTGIGGPAGRSVCALLLQRGHEVVGADTERVDLIGLSNFFLAPPAADVGYERWLHAALNGIDLLIPTTHDELPKVAAWREQLPCPALVGSFNGVSIAQDKWYTAQTLEKAGIPVPATALPSHLTSPDQVEQLLGWPCLSKPRNSYGGFGIQIYDRSDDFTRLIRLDDTLGDTMVVQQFVPGVEYSVNLTVDEIGRATVVVLEKLALCHGRTGNASIVVSTHAPDVAAIAVNAARVLKLTSPLDIDVRRDRKGKPMILEVNARFGAHIRFASQVFDRAFDQAVQSIMARRSSALATYF